MYNLINRAVAIGALLIVLLAVASVSGPTTVWTNSATGNSTQVAPSPNPDTTLATTPAARSNRNQLSIPFLGETVTLVVSVFLAVMALFAIREIGPSLTRRSSRLPRQRKGSEEWDPLAEVTPLAEHIDVVAARKLLRDNTPRNAIINCWIQLQQDLASVGFKPVDSETPTEYVQRIEGGQMDGLSPIAELAALYTEARFSLHELTETHRASAVDSLDRISTPAKPPARSQS